MTTAVIDPPAPPSKQRKTLTLCALLYLFKHISTANTAGFHLRLDYRCYVLLSTPFLPSVLPSTSAETVVALHFFPRSYSAAFFSVLGFSRSPFLLARYCRWEHERVICYRCEWESSVESLKKNHLVCNAPLTGHSATKIHESTQERGKETGHRVTVRKRGG